MSSIPIVGIEVLEPSTRPREADALACVIGRDLVVDPRQLGAYHGRVLSPRIDDLVLLAGAVAFADRAMTRRTARSWRRDLTLAVPVREPDFWNHPTIATALTDTLGSLTGDAWTFAFGRRRTPLSIEPQAVLPLDEEVAVTMPFSDGLDSLAVARLAADDEPRAGMVLVTTGRVRDVDGDRRRRLLDGRRRRVSVPLSFPRHTGGGRLRESSYRSRAFLYGVMAGVAAHLFGATRVLVAESGQGALGPWLLPDGNEAPDLRTHPVFTRRLSAFLGRVFERPVRFDHPRLWSTKGETLRELNARGLADDWAETRSCGRDARDASHAGRRAHCGICAGCLFRRQSLLAAGLDERKDVYLWPHLSAATLTGAALDARGTRYNDRRQAACGVLALANLAGLDAHGTGRAVVDDAAANLAFTLNEPVGATAARLRRLLAAHHAEWRAFVAAQGPSSFVARWEEAARC